MAATVSATNLTEIKELGRGTSGVVRLMVHEPSQTKLALKQVLVETGSQVRKQLLGELRTLFNCNCDYVVRYYGAYFAEGSVNVALEFMDGGSLSDLIRPEDSEHPLMDERIVAQITFQALSGLGYLHRKHLVHRDVKPANMLMNSEGWVKIADFGVSGQLDATKADALTFVGTVSYMSPERITGEKYGYVSDIFSLGLTVLEIAMGQFPFKSGTGKAMTFWDLMDVVVNGDIPEGPASYSDAFRDFIRLSTAKDPAARGSAKDLLQHPWIRARASRAELGEWIQNPASRAGGFDADDDETGTIQRSASGTIQHDTGTVQRE